MKIVSS